METNVAGVLEPKPGRCTSMIVSVRLAPRSPPVANSACCSGERFSRPSEPTSSQVVPSPCAGRPG